MSKIDALIAELCPEGVRWLPINSLVKRRRGISITASQMKQMPPGDMGVRIFAGGRTFVDVDSQAISQDSIVQGPAIIVKSRGIIEFAFWSGLFTHKNELWSYTSDSEAIELRFLYLYLKSQTDRFIALAKSKSVKMPQLTVDDTDLFKVPVPPLEVQREIVSILDKFTQLEAELEAELEARTIQYEVIRGYLFGFGSSLEMQAISGKLSALYRDGIRYAELGEVVRIRNGRDYKHLPSGGVPVYGSGGVMTRVSEAAYGAPSVLIPRKGSLGNLFFVDEPFWTVDTIFYTEISDQLEPKYLFYFLKTQDLASMNLAGGVPSLTQTMLNRIPIPIPPLGIQREVVSILDKLDFLVNDIYKGLPAEIAARQEQYAHYRNKLLTFKELESA